MTTSAGDPRFMLIGGSSTGSGEGGQQGQEREVGGGERKEGRLGREGVGKVGRGCVSTRGTADKGPVTVTISNNED